MKMKWLEHVWRILYKSGVLPVAMEFMDRLCIETSENFANAGYPDAEALLIVEVEGSEPEIEEQLDKNYSYCRKAQSNRTTRE